jgi:hypothetical protein
VTGGRRTANTAKYRKNLLQKILRTHTLRHLNATQDHAAAAMITRMWIVAIAWMYVALMMAAAEATHPGGSIGGALVTLLAYGVGPLALVMYLLATPARRRRRRLLERAASDDAVSGHAASTAVSGPGLQADGGPHASGDTVAPIGKEP